MNIYHRFRFLTTQYRVLFVWGIHVLLVTSAFGLAVLLSGQYTILAVAVTASLTFLPFVIVVKLFLFHRFSLFRGSWRYVETHDLVKILKATTWAAVILMVGAYLFASFRYQVIAMDWVISLVFIAGSRLTLKHLDQALKLENARSVKRAMIIGAGDAGEMICREMLNNPALGYLPVCFIDDQPKKRGLQIHGVPVSGESVHVPDLVRRLEVDEIIMAIPSARRIEFEQIFKICKITGIPFKTVPTTRAILEGFATVKQLRDVRLEDLLTREPVKVDDKVIRHTLVGQSVLITGAGGSIGSELARQVVDVDPAKVILYERNETSLYDIELELNGKLSEGCVFPILGDILDGQNLDRVMSEHKPQWVFHAAAYKHVPMMELNPIEAVKVNILGTQRVIEAAMRQGVRNLVFISTDKAVYPSSIMGMTKRIGEIIALNLPHGLPATVTVRFGNVLGSNGSVLPLFRRQIKEGGPVTVTHPEVSRFFMTITEAVKLVLAAGVLGKGGETYILDMGDQIKIVDLARKLITLEGLVPDQDVEMIFTGLRPGEKLHEELLFECEAIVSTNHEKIKRVTTKRLSHLQRIDRIHEALKDLDRLVLGHDDKGVIRYLNELILEIDGKDMRRDTGAVCTK